MSHNIIIAITVIVVIIVGSISYAYLYGSLALCSGVASKDRIVMGFTVALSGPPSAQGTKQLRAYQIRADYIDS